MSNEQAGQAPEASFLTILYTMATQAMIALGEIENPITKERQREPRKARWHFDSLKILREKTAGNLDEKEQQALDDTIAQVEELFGED